MAAIGIMGGTFDPIHYGHLVCAEEARTQFNLDKVIFVPNNRPPHKEEYQITPAEHRYIMVSLAIASNPYFEISRVEIDRPGPSYAIDTVREFKSRYGEDTEIYFITGADAILEILTWHDSDNLVGLCEFIAATRPGYDLSKLQKKLKPEYLEHIHFLPIPFLDISSTDIRKRVKEGKPFKYFMPESVELYILRNGLYKDV